MIRFYLFVVYLLVRLPFYFSVLLFYSLCCMWSLSILPQSLYLNSSFLKLTSHISCFFCSVLSRRLINEVFSLVQICIGFLWKIFVLVFFTFVGYFFSNRIPFVSFWLLRLKDRLCHLRSSKNLLRKFPTFLYIQTITVGSWPMTHLYKKFCYHFVFL